MIFFQASFLKYSFIMRWRKSEFISIRMILYAYTACSANNSSSSTWLFEVFSLFKLCKRDKTSEIRWYFSDLCRISRFENWLKNCDVFISRRFILEIQFVLIIDVCLHMFIMITLFVWIIIDFFNDWIKCFIFLMIQISFAISSLMSQ